MTKSFSGRSCSTTRSDSHFAISLTLLRRDTADLLARDLAFDDRPLRIQRQADVRLQQPRLQALGLREEVGPSGLDVEQQQRLRAARALQVAIDDLRGLLGAVHAVVAGVGVGDRRDELERRQHRTRLALVGARHARQARRGARRRADAEDPEALVLGRAVEPDDAVIGEDPAPAARQLRALWRGRGRDGVRALAGIRPARARREHGDREQRRQRAERGGAASPVDAGRLAHAPSLPLLPIESLPASAPAHPCRGRWRATSL